MKSKLEVLDDFFSDAEKNMKQYKPRMSKLDKIFVEHKEKLLDLLANSQMSIRQVYLSLLERQVLENTPYISFYQWIKRKQKERTQEQEHTTPRIENYNKKNIEIFHGFDIVKELDEVDNPLPDTLNISSNFLIEAFKKEHELTNDLVALVMLNIIDKKRKNIFKKSWSLLLMNDSETMNEYSIRLQELVEENPSIEDEVLTLTSTVSRYASAANLFQFQQIRRQT